MERKNVLDKFKDIKEKGIDFLTRMTSTDGDVSRSMDDKKGPDKSMVFSADELKGKPK